MTTKDEREGIAAITGAMDRRSVMGVFSDLLDVIMSGVAHVHHLEERDEYTSGLVGGMFIAFAVAVDGVELEEGGDLDVRELHSRGMYLVSAATEMMRQGMQAKGEL